MLAPALVVEADLGVGKVAAHDVGQVAQADGRAAGVVHLALAAVHQGNTDERLGDVLDVDGQPPHILVGEAHRFAPGRQRYAAHVVHGAAHLVGPGHVSRPDAGDTHAVVLVEHFGLKFVEYLVSGVLAGAEYAVVLVGLAVTEIGLLPAHRHRTGVNDAIDAQQSSGFKAVVHAQDIQTHLVVRVSFAAAEQIGQVDDTVGLRFDDGVGHLLELGDVHPRSPDRVSVNARDVRYRVDV